MIRHSLLVVMVVSGAVVIPTAAFAGIPLCPAARACVYTDRDWTGLLGYKSAGSGLSDVSTNAEDKMTSWENTTARRGAWFEDDAAKGYCRNLYAGQENSYVGWGDNDELSSWRMTKGC